MGSFVVSEVRDSGMTRSCLFRVLRKMVMIFGGDIQVIESMAQSALASTRTTLRLDALKLHSFLHVQSRHRPCKTHATMFYSAPEEIGGAFVKACCSVSQTTRSKHVEEHLGGGTTCWHSYLCREGSTGAGNDTAVSESYV